jgi:CRP/FNR family cyclic AMP-dependent transcriptional regulator
MLEHLKPIIGSSITRDYSAGSTILYQGEAPRLACVLAEGIVRAFSISAQGDEQIETYHVAGEFFPSSWIFGKAPSTLFFYEAVTDCKVAFMQRSELIEFMLAQPQRMHAMLDYFTTNYSASLIRVNALEQPKAKDKLIYTLYYLCQRYGEYSLPKVEIPLNLTHQNLASLVGLTRETTATEMNKLKKQGVITYAQQRYTIDQEKLLDLIGEDSFRGIKIPINRRH